MNTQNLEHRFEKIYAKLTEHTYYAPNRADRHTDYYDKQTFPCIARLGTKLWVTKRVNQQYKVSNVTKKFFLRVNANASEDKQTTWFTLFIRNNPKNCLLRF